MGNHKCPKEGEEAFWSQNVIIFHGNAGKKLKRYSKSKPHTDVILAIISIRIYEVFSGPIGIENILELSFLELLQWERLRIYEKD